MLMSKDPARRLLLKCLVGREHSSNILMRISCSLYLSHLLVFLSLVYGFEKIAPPAVVIWLVPPAAVALAALLYRGVEKPAMALGETLRCYAVGEGVIRPERIPVVF